MNGDRAIRAATAAVVVAVAAFAAIVSYSHIFDLGRTHGASGTAAKLLPLSVDGLILAMSLVLLHEARNDREPPALARFMLWLGIGATMAANALYGLPWGTLGAVINTWPAVAFLGTVHAVMHLVRVSRAWAVPGEANRPAPAAPEPAPIAPEPVPAGSNGHDKAVAAFADDLAAGHIPPLRRIRAELHCGQERAREVQAHLRALART